MTTRRHPYSDYDIMHERDKRNGKQFIFLHIHSWNDFLKHTDIDALAYWTNHLGCDSALFYLMQMTVIVLCNELPF